MSVVMNGNMVRGQATCVCLTSTRLRLVRLSVLFINIVNHYGVYMVVGELHFKTFGVML